MHRNQTDTLPLERSAFMPRAVIASGEGDVVVEARGHRGLSNEAAFALQERVQWLASGDHYDDSAWKSVLSATFVDITEDMRLVVGPGVIALGVWADVEDGRVRLVVDGVDGIGSDTAAGRSLHEAFCVVEGGQAVTVKIQGHGDGVSNTDVRSWVIFEVPLHPPSSLLLPATMINVHGELTDVDTVTLTPRVSGLPSYIYCRTRSLRVVPAEVPSGGLACDVSASGLGGLLGTSEAANTGYSIHCATDGTTPVLFGVLNGSNPRHLDVQADDNDYRAMSRVCGFAANNLTATDASPADLAAFHQSDGRYTYLEAPADCRVVNAYKSITPAAVNLEDWVPHRARLARVKATGQCDDGSAKSFAMWLDSGGTIQIETLHALANLASGRRQVASLPWVIPIGDDIAGSAYVGWSSSVTTGGGYIDVRGFLL